MILALLSLLARPADACLWDRDTLAVEEAGLPEVLTVITGRFDRYPAAYYTLRLAAAQATLAQSPDDLAAYDDAAVSLDRLGRSTEAIALMEAKAEVLARLGEDTEHRYRLLANQGTFYAHRWLSGGSEADLSQAIALIEAAIALNPDAHFGREAVQLQALRWFSSAPPLASAEDILTQPGLLGFEDWLHQTIAAVSRGEVAADLDRTIEGLTGLIVLGAAWESPDIHLELSRALYASGQSNLAWMARLRVVELLDAGQTFRQPTDLPVAAIRAVLLEESLQITAHGPAVSAEYQARRAAAEAWRKERDAWMTARLATGRHPDTDPDFWTGAP